MNNLVKDSIDAFIESLKNDQKVSNMLSEVSEKIRRNIKDSSALTKEIIKVAKSKGYTFTEKDISEYFKETVNELTDEDLKKASGGVGENMSFGQKLAVGAAGIGIGIGGAGLALNFIGGGSENDAKNISNDVSKVQKHENTNNLKNKPKEAEKVKGLTTKRKDYSPYDDESYLNSSSRSSYRPSSSRGYSSGSNYYGGNSGGYYGSSSGSLGGSRGGYYGGRSGLGGRNRYTKGLSRSSRFSPNGDRYSSLGSGFGNGGYNFSDNLEDKNSNNLNQLGSKGLNSDKLAIFEKVAKGLKSTLKEYGYNLSTDEIKQRIFSAVNSGEWFKIKSDEDMIRVLTKGLAKSEGTSVRENKKPDVLKLDDLMKADKNKKVGKENKVEGKEENNEEEEKTIDELIKEGKILIRETGKTQDKSESKKSKAAADKKTVEKTVNKDKGNKETKNVKKEIKDELNGNIAFITEDLVPEDGNIEDIISALKEKCKDLQAIIVTKPKEDKSEEFKLSNLPKDVKQISKDKIKDDNILAVVSLTDEAEKVLNNAKDGIGNLEIENKETEKGKETIAAAVMSFQGKDTNSTDKN